MNFSWLHASECGSFTIARFPWASAEILAEIDRTVISAGFECSVELYSTDASSALTSMIERGEPQLIPELWIDSITGTLKPALDAQHIVLAAEPLFDGAIEGWWIPAYVAEKHTEIKSIDDALARPDLFPSLDNPDSGAVYNCPPQWDCHVINMNLFKAFDGQKKGFTLIDTETSAGLDGSIAQAYESGTGWLGYYWSPSAVLGRYPMVKLEMGEHNKEHWESCTAILDCENPSPNAWQKSKVYSIAVGDFKSRYADISEYLSVRSLDSNTMNELLAWMVNEQATAEEAGRHFFSVYEDIWSTWVDSAKQNKIKNAL